MDENDRRLNVEGRILAVLAKYGGTRIVAGKKMTSLIQELTNEILKMREDGTL